MVKKSRGPGLSVIFTSYNCLRLILLCTAGLLVTACQFIPTGQPADKTATAVASAEGSVAVVKHVNPYLSNRPTVANSARIRFQVANDALAAGQWAEAEAELLWLTTYHRGLSGPWLNLALLYSELDEPDKAAVAFKQAISSNGDNVAAYNQYAAFLRQQGDFATAEKYYLQALELWPDYRLGHLNLGILYDLYMGRLKPALQHYQAYQTLLDKPDRKVTGWIVDTQRRIKRQRAVDNGSQP